MRLDLNDEPGICYKHSQLHQAIAATNCSIFAMCLHKIIVSFATLTMLRCRLAYWVSCCWLQSPQKPLSWANRHLRGFSTITHHSSQQTYFLPIVFSWEPTPPPHCGASFACKAQRNVVEDPGCCKISHKDCATAFRFQEHILTAQSGATWSSWWCWWCRKAYTSWCDLKTIKMNYTDLTIPQVMQECATFFQISLRHCLNFILSVRRGQSCHCS